MKAPTCLCLLALLASPSLFGEDLFLANWETFQYPVLATQALIAGDVELDATVGPSGTVIRTKVISGHRLLAEAAETALRKWRFGRRDADTALAGETTVRFHFSFQLQGAVDYRPRTTMRYTHPWRVTVVGEAVNLQPDA